MTPPAWPSLIRDLQAAGLSLRDIAARATISRSSVHRLAHEPDYEPRFNQGTRLIDLYTATCVGVDTKATPGPARTRSAGCWGRDDEVDLSRK